MWVGVVMTGTPRGSFPMRIVGVALIHPHHIPRTMRERRWGVCRGRWETVHQIGSSHGTIGPLLGVGVGTAGPVLEITWQYIPILIWHFVWGGDPLASASLKLLNGHTCMGRRSRVYVIGREDGPKALISQGTRHGWRHTASVLHTLLQHGEWPGVSAGGLVATQSTDG